MYEDEHSEEERLEDFSTDRLSVTHWAAQLGDDGDMSVLERGVAKLLTPKVLKFLPAELALSEGEDAVSEWITARDESASVYTVRLKADNRLIGLLILSERVEQTDDEDNAPDVFLMLGYLFADSEWKQGYASELIAGALNGFDEFDMPCVRAGVASGNDASARVLEKNGFELNEALSSDDLQMYEINA
ncbi:GNAT family N-acetyltransferase [Planktotalea sp.]|uniref:GNAT family N-acetyltransferase n=1 Tax=Planktotalea sp. TaxID=2029877 RepID=UPI003D6C4E99